MTKASNSHLPCDTSFLQAAITPGSSSNTFDGDKSVMQASVPCDL